MLRLLATYQQQQKGAVKALEKLNTVRVDLVLTDIRMPKEDGFCLLEAIRTKLKAPVIAVTAEGMHPTPYYIGKRICGPFVQALYNEPIESNFGQFCPHGALQSLLSGRDGAHVGCGFGICLSSAAGILYNYFRKSFSSGKKPEG